MQSYGWECFLRQRQLLGLIYNFYLIITKMKKIFLIIVAFFALCFQSCHQDEVVTPVNDDVISQKANGLDYLRKEIHRLDAEYCCQNVFANNHIRKTSGSDTLRSIIEYDVTGFMLGWKGSWFIPNPYVKGLAGAIVGGVASYAKYMDYNNGRSLSSMSQTLLANVVDFRALDLRQPINPNAPTQLYNTNVVGKNVGPIHNRVILSAYKVNHLDPQQLVYDDALFDSISNEATNPEHLQYGTIADLMHEAHYLSDDDLVNSLNQQFAQELSIINYVYEVSLNLDSTTLLDYTNNVMGIVHQAKVNNLITDSTAWLINGSISTLAHTRLLWKTYLPDYRLSTLYMAYIDDFHKWVLCSRTQLQDLATNYHVPYVGIPGVIDGKCTEIFFFPSSTTYYNVYNSHFHHLTTDDYLDIDANTTFERLVNVYSNHFFDHMTVLHRHVFNVPNENGITYVSFVEEY